MQESKRNHFTYILTGKLIKTYIS